MVALKKELRPVFPDDKIIFANLIMHEMR